MSKLSLGRDKQALLHHTVSTPGFEVVKEIMKDVADQYITLLLNTANKDVAAVLSNHVRAQVAAQHYESVAQRINQEIFEYVNAPLATDKPVDMTDGLLDLDSSRELTDIDDIEEML